MKFIKWKTFIITSVICLLPILLGVSLWDKLPDTMAIHFDVYGNPDNFAGKGIVVFGLPVFMALVQGISCIGSDINAHKNGGIKKFESVIKWIIPCITVALQIVTLGYGLGWNLDIRKAVALIVGCMFLVVGNYLPKFDKVKNFNVDTEKARKINRFMGYEMVILGLLFLISMFLPPISTVICLVLLIVYAIISVVYGIIVSKK